MYQGIAGTILLKEGDPSSPITKFARLGYDNSMMFECMNPTYDIKVKYIPN
jgi:hypothetical protein